MASDAPPNTGRPELRVGSYRLVKALGIGGMSSVFRAEHVENGLEIALKILPRNLAKNKTLLQRFLREAKSAEALEHPNIVAIYDHGMDDGRYYLVLEYVAGGDLHDWVRTQGPMPIADAIAAIRAVAEGLKFAAERGLIHRDIKPANLLRATDGRVKIADLGLALQADDEDERVTREGTTVGTVDYMSPEQARDSRATSIRSDIYSLGCTFWFLLTGQPPYPGGDIAEKLARHCSAKPPELAGFRPEATLALNRLLHKMMAKRPENRFANYDDLIAALDAEGSPALFAILDDDSINLVAPSDGFVPLTLATPRAPSPPAERPDAGGFSLAELAALDDDGADHVRPRAVPVLAAPASPVPLVLVPVEGDESHAADSDEEALADEGTMPGQVALGQGRRMTDSERSWVTICVAVGLALIAFVIGADLVIRSTTTPQETVFPLETASERPAPTVPEAERPTVRNESPLVVATTKRAGGLAVRTIPIPAPTEPIDGPPERAAEASYPAAVEARYRPDWAALAVPGRLPGKVTTLRRIPDPRDADQKPTLRAALDVLGGGTIEVADDGPFFEDDWRLVGDSRAIRARPGFRPLISLEGPRNEALKQQPALCVIEGRSLLLDGLDLVIDGKALGAKQSAVFLCKGGSLTLRNCSVTIVNRGGLPFSLVRAGPSEAVSRVLIERTFIRGALDSVVDLAGGPADVVLRGSAIINGDGSVLSASGAGTGDRKVFVTRCVLGTRGPAFATARPLFVRALGTTFAHIESPTRPTLVAARGTEAAADLLNWEGTDNAFEGWSGWLSAGNPLAVRVPTLAAARTVWPGTDKESRENGRGSSLAAPFDVIEVAKLRSIHADRADVLTRLPTPTPYLAEKTIADFPAPADPGFAPFASAPSPSRLSAPSGSSASAVGGEPRTVDLVGEREARSESVVDGVRDLDFPAGGPPWGGDLGRFLAASVRRGDRLLRVRASGSGTYPFTPVRLPEGVGLDLSVAHDGGGRFPTWYAPIGTTAEALIDIRGASARLFGLYLARDGSATLKSLVRVERGHLAVHRCRLTSSGTTGSGGGGLLAFVAPGSLPMPRSTWNDPSGAWPFERVTDKPTCRIAESVLVSSGDVLSAGLGRGLVMLRQCLVIAGATAFTLSPSAVARHRLEADLALDHCTICAEANVVALRAWPGAEPGPDRPWLVTSHRCAFFGASERPPHESVMLRVEPESFARGTLFWQGTGDAFEVPVFTASTNALVSEKRRPDVTQQWTDLWGLNHFHAVLGPHSPSYSPSARPVAIRLKPGRVDPGDLFIDPGYPAENPPPRDLGADLSALGFSPSARPGRRR